MFIKKVLCLSVIYIFLVQCNARAYQHPTVHLHAGTIQTGRGASLSRTTQRRAVLEHDFHTRSRQWGLLRDAVQYIVTHRPDLSHAERVDLLNKLQERGLQVAGYIPDSSLLVVGPSHAVQQVEGWPAVVWMGLYRPEYKRAPEWQSILERVTALPTQTSIAGGAAALNSTEMQRGMAVAVSELPCRVERGADGQPRLGIQVRMPRAGEGGLAGPTAHAEYMPGLTSSRSSNLSSSSLRGAAARLSRLLGDPRQRLPQQHQQQQQHAGEAATADWAAALDSLCSSGTVTVRPAGRSQAVVFCPPQCLEAVLDWLAQRPAVHWLAPLPKLRLHAYQASSISQSGKPVTTWTPSMNTDASYHPLWAAGITGAGQVIGCGDSGVDRRHCFFKDPNIDDAAWKSHVSYQDSVKTFDCPDCRKIIYYRAFGDESDANGHGTHVTGTLLGFPYTASSLTSPDTQYIGMAPGARLAFIDLGDGSSDSIYTPADLEGGYFDYTKDKGAYIHSNSWGSATTTYDDLAVQVDEYHWKNPQFLAVFAAGNEGDVLTRQGESGASTVTSPATSKNAICVGATQTANYEVASSASHYVTYLATVTEGGNYSTSFRVLQADFGREISSLGSQSYPLVAASPLLACTALQSSVQGAVVLIQRGQCNFDQKAVNAQQAGAVAALVFDNLMGSYFVLGSNQGTTVTIPTMSTTRRLGQQILDSITIGRSITIAFQPATTPSRLNSFENLAAYSSQGPTRDNRIKPDLVAPGTIYSAKRLTTVGGNDCDRVLMAGTSMATPVVAGSATLVRQYFMDGYYPSGKKDDADKLTPSGALIKAVLISGAASLQGVEADTGLPIDPPPSFRQGFGRVNLGLSVYLDGGSTRLQVVDGATLNTGDSHEYCIRANGGPMKVSLVWTDYPGSPAARKALVNDLDLTVRAEGYNGKSLFGNGGSVTDSSSPDRENNVEVVSLEDLPEGRVSIEVRGYSVYAAGGAQPYALVVTGDFTGSLTKLGDNGTSGCAIVVAVIKTGPPGVTRDDVTFTFGTQSGNDKGVSFQCQLTDAQGNPGGTGLFDWRDCTSPQTLTNLPDGSYQFSVRAKGEKIVSTQSFKQDRTPPVVSLSFPTAFSSQSSSPTANDTAQLAFTASDTSDVTFTCRLSGSGTSSLQKTVYAGTVNSAPMTLAQPYNCTSPQTYHWLLPGSWTFSVVGTDAAGNAAPSQTYSWTVAFEAGKQYTRLFSGLFQRVPGIPASFTYGVLQLSGSDVTQVNGAATVCWLENITAIAGGSSPNWQTCTSPANYGTLGDGDYRFHARAAAVPSAADTDAVSAFTVDSTPPIAGITSAPEAIHTSRDADIKFTSNEDGSTFQCRLVNEDDSTVGNSTYVPCTSPATYLNLTDGLYDFSVVPTDQVGNRGNPVNATFTIDTTPPVWTSVDYPVATKQNNITVTFAATDGRRSQVQNITCRFRPLQLKSGSVNATQSEWDPCTSPQVYNNLQEGHYGLTLRATDLAGLVNQTQEFDIWVDSTPPVASIAGPSKTGKVGSTVTFNLAEQTSLPPGTASNISTYQCLLQAISEGQYNGILNGSITTLTGPGSAGSGGSGSSGGDGSGGGGNVVLQSVAGPASEAGTAGAAGTADASGTRVVWPLHLLDTGSSGGSTLNSSAVGVRVNASSPVTYAGLGDGYYALQTRAVDLAGNQGQDTAPYPFAVKGGGGGVNNLVWIIVGSAVGAVLVLAIVFVLVWRRRRRRLSAPTGAAMGAAQATRPPVSNGYHQNGYQSGYPPPAQGYPVQGVAGAWGYNNGAAFGQPLPVNPIHDPVYQQQLALEAAQRPANHAPAQQVPPNIDPDALFQQQLAYALAASQQEPQQAQQAPPPLRAPPPPPPADQDSVFQQQLAYALAASQHEPQRAQQAPTVAAPPPPRVPPPLDEEEQMRRAIQASLQEQRGQGRPSAAAAAEQDPEVRAAIEASLREQQRLAELSPWASSPTAGGAAAAGRADPGRPWGSSFQ